MYNPLPPRLTIKPSLISGLGLFATAGIAQGTDLGTTHIKIDGEIFRTPLGGFINCDENANCVKVEMRTEGSITDKWNLVTLRNINNGEELTLKYTFYSVKNVKTVSEKLQDELEPIKDFLEEAEKEKEELEESYQEALRQTRERKNFHPKAMDGYGE
jgi:hypothetical protein